MFARRQPFDIRVLAFKHVKTIILKMACTSLLLSRMQYLWLPPSGLQVGAALAAAMLSCAAAIVFMYRNNLSR